MKDQKRKEGLATYRRVQVMYCIDRDLALCAICWFRDGVKTPYTDIHHVYGRGKEAGDAREQYKSLLCTCRDCHPPPAQDKGSKQAWVIEIARQANLTPVNREFEHPYKDEE